MSPKTLLFYLFIIFILNSNVTGRRKKMCLARNDNFWKNGLCRRCTPCKYGTLRNFSEKYEGPTGENGDEDCLPCKSCPEGFYVNAPKNVVPECIKCRDCASLYRNVDRFCADGRDASCGSCETGYEDIYGSSDLPCIKIVIPSPKEPDLHVSIHPKFESRKPVETNTTYSSTTKSPVQTQNSNVSISESTNPPVFPVRLVFASIVIILMCVGLPLLGLFVKKIMRKKFELINVSGTANVQRRIIPEYQQQHLNEVSSIDTLLTTTREDERLFYDRLLSGDADLETDGTLDDQSHDTSDSEHERHTRESENESEMSSSFFDPSLTELNDSKSDHECPHISTESKFLPSKTIQYTTSPNVSFQNESNSQLHKNTLTANDGNLTDVTEDNKKEFESLGYAETLDLRTFDRDEKLHYAGVLEPPSSLIAGTLCRKEKSKCSINGKLPVTESNDEYAFEETKTKNNQTVPDSIYCHGELPSTFTTYNSQISQNKANFANVCANNKCKTLKERKEICSQTEPKIRRKYPLSLDKRSICCCHQQRPPKPKLIQNDNWSFLDMTNVQTEEILGIIANLACHDTTKLFIDIDVPANEHFQITDTRTRAPNEYPEKERIFHILKSWVQSKGRSAYVNVLLRGLHKAKFHIVIDEIFPKLCKNYNLKTV